MQLPRRALLLAAIVAAALLLGARSDHASAHYYDPCAFAAPESSDANVASDINLAFGVGVGADCTLQTADDNFQEYNSGGQVNFTPPAWGVAEDDDIPDGTVVGTVTSKARLGLLNNPCNVTLPVNFDLLEGTTDTSKPISPNPPGTPDRLRPLAQDGDADGVPDGASHWPDYLDAVAQVNGWDLQQMRARYVGFNTTSVPGTTIVFNFIVFEPGAQVVAFSGTDPRLGYPAMTVLQDPTARTSTQDPVNDFCAPLETRSTIFGMAGGQEYRKNPGDGQYNFVTFTFSRPDADEDGIENQLDPCPLDPDLNWDPRGDKVQPGDADGDGLPSSCDPFPNQPSNGTSGTGIAQSDGDNDGWMNRNDNCAIVANADQADTDLDAIGDACDPDPVVYSGHFHLVCLVTTVTVGVGGSTPDAQSLAPCDPGAPVPAQGDADCTGGINSLDGLAILRFLAHLDGVPGCPVIPLLADVNCSGQVDSVDALNVLQFVAHLPTGIPASCWPV